MKQIQQAERMESERPQVKISAEGSPIPVYARRARPVPIRTDMDISTAVFSHLSPIDVDEREEDVIG